VRTTLNIDEDVVVVARQLAVGVEADNGLPVIRVPAGTLPITPEMVRRALHED
jgi:hypothetical protein